MDTRELEAELARFEKARKAEAEKAKLEEKARKAELKKDKKSCSKLMSMKKKEEREASSAMEIYVADDQTEEALANASIAGFRKLENGETYANERLGGYFTVLSAVSPDILELAKQIASTLCLVVKEIKVPSEHTEANVKEKSDAYATGAVDFVVAQLVYLPFLKKPRGQKSFWKKIARKAKLRLDDKLFVLLPSGSVAVMYSTLKLSGFWDQLYDNLYDLQLLLSELNDSSLGVLFRMVADYAAPSSCLLQNNAYVLKQKKRE